MSRKADAAILVVARSGVDIQAFSNSERVRVACGTIGGIIARKVLEGGGEAMIARSDVRMAIDNTDGANIILDNFDLIDARTRTPLLFELLRK